MVQGSLQPAQSRPRPVGPKLPVDRVVTAGLFGALALILASGTIAEWLSPGPLRGPGRWLDEAIFGVIVVVMLLSTLTSGRLYLSRFLPGLLALSAAGLLSSLVNHVPLEIAATGYLLAAKPLILLIVCQMLVLSRPGAERALRLVGRFLAALILVAVAYAVIIELGIGHNPLPGVEEAQTRLGLNPARSFFFRPSPFSSMMTLAGLYFVSRYLSDTRRRDLLLVGLALLGVLLSARLKALLLLPVCALLLFGLIRVPTLRVKRRTLWLGAALLLLSLLLIASFALLLREFLILRLSPGADNVRNALLAAALAINVESVGLGAGLGMFGSATSVTFHYSPLYHDYGISTMWGAHPDNTMFITDQWWAWYLGEVGVLGTLIFLVTLSLIAAGLYQIGHRWRKARPALAQLAFASLAFLAFGVLSGYASTYLTAPPTGYFIMGLAGLVFALDRGLSRPGPATSDD
ncbi:MAG: hypothetical protein ACRDHL_02055 [Candidatus Promineifilaceae bacterium]